METKRCTRCKKELPLSMFWKNRRTKDGLHYQCKKCAKKYRIKEEADYRYAGSDLKYKQGYVDDGVRDTPHGPVEHLSAEEYRLRRHEEEKRKTN